MKNINALSLAPAVNNWLMNSSQPRILHIFDHACNLINERREVLSIVTPQIGEGPFNLVVESNVLFSEYLNAETSIFISDNQLTLGDLTLLTIDAKLWNPRPNWEILHGKMDDILDQLMKIQNTKIHPSLPTSLLSTLTTSIITPDRPSSLTAAKQLAGLGSGLTPAGDDFMVGAIYAAWIIHPSEIASVLAREITNTTAPLTTSLSAAWLKSAGKGETGVLWHNFFNALTSGDSSAIQLQITKLLSIGHTSGADALAGFIGMFISYAELETKSCHF